MGDGKTQREQRVGRRQLQISQDATQRVTIRCYRLWSHQPHMPKLIVMKGSAGTRQIALLEDETIIGRAATNGVVLDSMQVSRRHAIVKLDGAQATITDLGSLNGICVNGVRVRSRVLAGGDEISIGNFKLRFLAGDHDVSAADHLRLITTPELPAVDRNRETLPARV